MESIVRNNYSEEVHPWNWYIPSNANALLIGTFPTDERNRKHYFFYCSPTNRFWEILATINNKPLTMLDCQDGIFERQKILEALGLGLTDMGRKVLRQKGSSRDHSLFVIEFADIINILNLYPSITSIILSGSIQGNSSLSWFNTYCSLNSIKLDVPTLLKEKQILTPVFGRDVTLKIVYSPSRLSRVKTDILIENYKLVLGL